MINSLKQLYIHPFNRKRPIFALSRWLEWKFIRLLRLSNYRKKVWGNRYLHLNHDSLQSMWVMYNWIVDWEEFNFIESYLKPEDTVFDVGTNMGFYTVWMSRYLILPGKIHCFEPDDLSLKRLLKNIEINKLESIAKVNHNAVTDKEGEFFFTTGMDGENHLSQVNQEDLIKVYGISLDSYAQQNNILEIAYIKIDVEGFELSVLKGATELLMQKQILVIQLEINQQLRHSNADASQLTDFLAAYGYSLYSYDVLKKSLIPIQYNVQRENYFAIADITSVLTRLV
jgi:FkbM family methyltransferase